MKRSPRSVSGALVGRRRELALVTASLRARSALVTLHGPGGVGKTALSSVAASTARASGRFPGGVVEVSLVGLTTVDARVLAARVAAGLGVVARAREGNDAVAAALAARGRALVVLDECEGVVDALGAVLPGWREAAADVAWLLTSRRALGFRDERVVTLEGLTTASAVALLTARLAHVRPGFAPAGSDVASLERIARALDGLPLALELASSTAASQPLAALAVALDAHPLRLAGAPDRRPRHRSLAAAVESSLADLGPAATADLAALATLRAPFDLDAAAAVVGRDAATVLPALVSRSLARVDDATGRHRLYAAVRAFALEHLDHAAALPRHAAHFSGCGERWARAFHDGDAGWARPHLDASVDDLFAAATWAGVTLAQRLTLVAALDAALTPRGGSDALDGLMEESVAWAAREGDDTALVRARTVRARGRFLRGQVALAEEDMVAARAATGADARARREAATLYSAVLRGAGRAGEARATADEAMADAVAAGDEEAWLRAAHQRASARAMAGERVAAREEYLALLATARSRGARRVEALCVSNLGVVSEDDGFLDEAALRFGQGIAAFAAVGERLLAAKITAALARVLVAQGALDEAAARVAEALAMAAELRDQETAIEAALVGARIGRLQGRHAEAAVAVEDAYATAWALRLYELAGVAAGMRTTGGAAAEREALRVGVGAYWFEAPGGGGGGGGGAGGGAGGGGGGRRVELGRRPSLRRVLAHLVAQRASAPGAAASVEALLAAGWPGERVLPEAGAERVYTAVRTLRAMGLATVLVRRDGGYALDPAVPLARG